MLFLRSAAVAALLIAATAAQKPFKPDPEQEEPTIKVDVELVNILCSVRDKQGRFVNTLEKDDFTIVEDGKEQKLQFFAKESDLPLTIGLLVDVSGSQERLIEEERRAAAAFFPAVLRKRDMAFLMSFGEEAELLQDYTNSTKLLTKGLDDLRINSGARGIMPGPVPTISQPRGTILFDAVYLAAREKLQKEVGRKAIVLITDGMDQGSRVKIHDALEAAQKADVIVYSIYYADPRAYGGWYRVTDSDLKKMSEETGGRLFHVDRKHTLQNIFQEIQDEMRSQYALGYTAVNTARDGSYRRIEVKTRTKDLKVRTRKGYYAPEK